MALPWFSCVFCTIIAPGQIWADLQSALIMWYVAILTVIKCVFWCMTQKVKCWSVRWRKNGCSPFDCSYLLVHHAAGKIVLLSLLGSDGTIFWFCLLSTLICKSTLSSFCWSWKSKWKIRCNEPPLQAAFWMSLMSTGPTKQDRSGKKSQLFSSLLKPMSLRTKKRGTRAWMINTDGSGEPSACILPLVYVRICQDNC